MKKQEVPANPGRLIGAVANIGYDPEVALCDLIDNSIDANANFVKVSLEKENKEAEGVSDTVGAFVIIDDGFGMDEKTLISAFTLGTSRDYPSGSLGKFGLGLKSAGLSLGSEIVLISAMTGADPLCARLSIEEVERSGKYEIDLGDIPDDLRKYWEEQSLESGTVLLVRQLNDNRPSYSAFSEYLQRYCSVIYHRFLERDEKQLKILVNGNVLIPFDPLFLADARANGSLGDPKEWDGKTIHLLMDDARLSLGEAHDAIVSASHLVHPPSFGAKRAEVGEQYAIVTDPYNRRPRNGFYVYRNNRIISLGERFHGLVGSQQQNWAFKARLMFDETADSVLSLDVKKRHCLLPRKARNTLKAMISSYQAKSVTAWKEAGERLEEEKKATKDDLANESMANTSPASLDYQPGGEPVSDASLVSRRNRQREISEEAIDSIHDQSVSKEALDKHAREGDVVIKVQGIRGNAMWLPYPAVEVGRAETIVNDQHSWVSEAYRASENEPSVTIVLHQLFTILARAELDVRSTDWNDLGDEQVRKTFERYRRRVSTIGEDLAENLEAALSDDSMETEE